MLLVSLMEIIEVYGEKEETNGEKGKCHSVKCARGARFGRLAKTRPKGAGSHAISGRNHQRRFMRLKVRQRKNRQRRLLTNMGWTRDCPSQAGKLVRGIG